MNQYPPQFYQPIIENTITKIIDRGNPKQKTQEQSVVDAEESTPKKMIFIQYRGRATEDYCRAFERCGALVNPILTLSKLKTVLPSLKTSVDHHVISGVVY